jgi:hypothetical protein
VLTPQINFESSDSLLCIDTGGFDTGPARGSKKRISDDVNMIDLVTMCQALLNTKNEGIGAPHKIREVSCINGMVFILRFSGSKYTMDIQEEHVETLLKVMMSFSLTHAEILENETRGTTGYSHPFVTVIVTGLSRYEATSRLRGDGDSED